MTANAEYTATAMALDTVRAHSGVDVTYTRGSESVTVTAIRRRPGWLSEADEHIHAIHELRDYVIEVSDIVLGGVTTTPARQDTITDSGVVYQVVPRMGLMAFEYLGHDQSWIQVFTKRQ